MLIQCPSCHARAKLADHHEGDKVRCAECGRVFLARSSGSRAGKRGGLGRRVWIAALLGALALLGVSRLLRSADTQARVAEVPRTEVPPAGHEARSPAPLGHLADTPEDVRRRIDALLATLLAPEPGVDASRAADELVALGRPAIPLLLTKLYETRADGAEDCARRAQLEETLRRITGQSFGDATGGAGPAAGTSEERRQISVEQWFAWWYKNQETFTPPKTADARAGQNELAPQEKP